MNKQDFIEGTNGAPISLEDAAQDARFVTDDNDLVASAVKFLNAQDEFEAHLDNIGVELG